MKKFFSIKYILSLVGIIILGSLSNPVWEFIIKPLCTTFYKIVLNISTLGLTILKNKIYLEIAKNFHERNGLEIYTLILSFMIAIYFIFVVKFIRRKFFENHKESTLSPFQGPISYIFLSIFIFAIAFLTVQSVKENYINSALTHYNQLIFIDKPFISQNEFDLYNSRFSQIKNKEDYSSIVKELEEISMQHNLVVPEFRFTF